jgi:hypothetical protein
MISRGYRAYPSPVRVKVINTTTAPSHWARWWLGMWVLVVVVLVETLFFVPWWAFLILFVIGFGIPEGIGVLREGDPYPPLTHVIRHFVAGWLAFPLLYGMIGAFGGKALDFKRWWAIGILFAVLGWITHHFMFTYIGRDPFPMSLHGESQRPT